MMSMSRPLLSLLLVALVAMPGRAQHAAPVALRTSDVGPPTVARGGAPFVATAPDTVAKVREFSPIRAVVGGVLGGTVGTFAGFALGSMASAGCVGEDCGLLGAMVGALLGESVGLAAGAHIGSRSPHHDRLIATSLASAGILFGGVFAGVGLGRVDGTVGNIMIPLTPAVQLATVLAIERF